MSKRSPAADYKKRNQTVLQNTQVRKPFDTSVLPSERYKGGNAYNNYENKEQKHAVFDNSSISSYSEKCPFDTTPFISFETSEVFSGMKRNNLQTTYDKATPDKCNYDFNNVLKPSNRLSGPDTDIFDKLTFTPLKSVGQQVVRMQANEPRVLINIDSDFDIEYNAVNNKENVASAIGVPSSANIKKYSTDKNYSPQSLKYLDDKNNKKIPNTSSPKELDSFNFTMNTDFSRISHDLSFFPQRFSTEKKSHPIKAFNENFHDLVDDIDLNAKCDSDTYTKPNSPKNMYPSLEYHAANQPLHHNHRSKHALFKDIQDMGYLRPEPNDYCFNRSPRSVTPPPPLHAIPEESTQYSDSKNFDKTDHQMETFTINRTFNKNERTFTTKSSTESWSKKSFKCEPELWKMPTVPPKKSICAKDGKKRDKPNNTFDISNLQQSFAMRSHVADVYSQSFTADPFSSTTYFYDEDAVDKFESEFKRWFNYILTPPADLDSNIENKVDFGKAWIENRNKEIPAAPTKEQVSSKYHNSSRLEKVRRAAVNLLKSPEITIVLQKLNAQIEKKLIAIRNDKNLHLDVGLQKIIMELLLSYNPLWLRIGLETIYGVVLPLRSNSDIEGLSTFIIQRMFKNPHLKNKNSKSIPNMLLPAYIEAVKKFTLKKFFTLVFLLDRAKEKKLISHDPCLFCRNAVCKESKEIIIRFTKELIAGIGDITRHLRPLGYVVCNKQSYLDEYKFAVHNIASDIRDGVRLTKTMEIILMRNGLLAQLRTPAISRLQKIHNVQVALNALKEANFVIVGDIAAQDIADGHREKTLSLLWQIIHVFRAPLFQKAANVIQAWWRKKYEVIVVKRNAERAIRQKLDNAASVIQCWWRRIQYNREVELKTRQFTTATIIIQKYWRMWSCQLQVLKLKNTVLKVEKWWICIKKIKDAKKVLATLKAEKQLFNLQTSAAITIQKNWRMSLCRRELQKQKRVVDIIETWWRCKILIREAKRTLALLQQEREILNRQIAAAIVLQKYFRMCLCRQNLRKWKQNAIKIEMWWSTILLMKEAKITLASLINEREELKKRTAGAVVIQKYWRMWSCREKLRAQKQSVKKIEMWWTGVTYINEAKRTLARLHAEREHLRKQTVAVIIIQKYWRMHSCKTHLQKLKTAVEKIEKWRKNVMLVKEAKQYLALLHAEREQLRKETAATIVIQKYWRMYVCKRQWQTVKNSVSKVQTWWKQMILIKQAKSTLAILYMDRDRLRKQTAAAIVIQKYWRMFTQKQHLQKLKRSVVTIEIWWTSMMLIKEAKQTLLTLQEKRELLRKQTVASIVIQKYWRMYLCKQRLLKLKKSVSKIEAWYGDITLVREAKKILYTLQAEREQLRREIAAAIVLQKYWRMYSCRHHLRTVKGSVTKIEAWWNCVKLIKEAKRTLGNLFAERELLRIQTDAAIIIQKYSRMWLCKRHMQTLKGSVLTVETWWKQIILIREAHKTLAILKAKREELQKQTAAAIVMQKYWRMWSCRHKLCIQKERVLTVEKWWISIIHMKKAKRTLVALKLERELLNKRIAATVVIQKYWRMSLCRQKLRRSKQSVITIETWWSGVLLIEEAKMMLANLQSERELFRKKSYASIVLQKYWRMYVCKKQLQIYKISVIKVETWWSRIMLIKEAKRSLAVLQAEKDLFNKQNTASVVIQKYWRMWSCRRKLYIVKTSVLKIEIWWRDMVLIREAKVILDKLKAEREQLQKETNSAIIVQKYWRMWSSMMHKRRVKNSVSKIETWWKGIIHIREAKGSLSLLREERERLAKENAISVEKKKKIHWAASKIQVNFSTLKANICLIDFDTYNINNSLF